MIRASILVLTLLMALSGTSMADGLEKGFSGLEDFKNLDSDYGTDIRYLRFGRSVSQEAENSRTKRFYDPRSYYDDLPYEMDPYGAFKLYKKDLGNFLTRPGKRAQSSEELNDTNDDEVYSKRTINNFLTRPSKKSNSQSGVNLDKYWVRPSRKFENFLVRPAKKSSSINGFLVRPSKKNGAQNEFVMEI